jgi:hypothetical protein
VVPAEAKPLFCQLEQAEAENTRLLSTPTILLVAMQPHERAWRETRRYHPGCLGTSATTSGVEDWADAALNLCCSFPCCFHQHGLSSWRRPKTITP